MTRGIAFHQAARNTLLGLGVKGRGPPGPEKDMRITGSDSGQRQGGECRKACVLKDGGEGTMLPLRGWKPRLWTLAKWLLLLALPAR